MEAAALGSIWMMHEFVRELCRSYERTSQLPQKVEGRQIEEAVQKVRVVSEVYFIWGIHTGGPFGGEGSLGGVGSLTIGSGFGADRRAGGGAGGAPRAFAAGTGLSDLARDGGAAGGGGGGARFLGLSEPLIGGGVVA